MKIFMMGTMSGFDDDSFASCEGGGPGGTYYRQGQVVEFTTGYPSWWRWGEDGCPNCGVACWVDMNPWPMKWREGSELIGDFAGLGVPCWNILAQKKVMDFFRDNDFFVNKYEAFFEEIPPKSPRSRKPRYPIVCTTPYQGPPFWRYTARYGVHMNEEKSQKNRLSSCSVCGHIRYEIKENPDMEDGEEYCWQNFVIDEEEWNGLKLFGVFEIGRVLIPRGVFLSEEGHGLLMKQGFSNINCIEVGRIEKAGHGKMKPYREQADYDFWKPDEFVPPPPKEKPKKRSKKQ